MPYSMPDAMVVQFAAFVFVAGMPKSGRWADCPFFPDAFWHFAAITAAATCVAVAFADDGLSPPPFQPAEISIGEPIALPTTPPAALLPLQSAPAPAALPAAAPMPGNGWIGLTVDDSVVTGRLVVVDVAANGPAASSGIRLQDQLLAINGLPLRSADQLAAALAAITPGTAVKVAIGRSDRIEEIELKAVPRPSARPAAGPLPEEWQPAAAVPGPIQQPAPMPAAIAAPPLQAPRSAVHTAVPAAVPAAKGRTALGVRTLPVDPAVQARFRLAEPAGALVVGVVQDLPASKAGIPPGSVIVALGERPVRSPSDLTSVVTSSPAGRPITLQYILPGGETRRAEVSLQSLELPLERALIGPDR